MEYLSGESGGRLMVDKKYNIPEGSLKNRLIEYQLGRFDNLTKKQNQDKFR